MRIEVCVCKERSKVSFVVELTADDLKERTWAKYNEVVLEKKLGSRGGFYSSECYVWESPNHNGDAVLMYDGNYLMILKVMRNMSSGEFTYESIGLEKFNELVATLESDKEWRETINNLRKFAESMLNKNLKQ